jgi:hypothetical protein
MAMEQRQDLGQPSNRKNGTPIWTGRSDENKTIHARNARREIGMTEEEFMRNLPAFPHEHRFGMTLRDYFAAKAMNAMYAASFEWEPTGIVRDPHHMAIMEEMAQDAYGIADAMLKAREA